MIKLRQNLYKSHFINGTESDKLYFKQFANKLTRMKTQSKKAFYYSAISERKNNPKRLWEFINSVIYTKRTIICYPFRVNVDNYETDDPSETSEIFNDYFVKIGESIAKKAKTMNDNADLKLF